MATVLGSLFTKAQQREDVISLKNGMFDIFEAFWSHLPLSTHIWKFIGNRSMSKGCGSPLAETRGEPAGQPCSRLSSPDVDWLFLVNQNHRFYPVDFSDFCIQLRGRPCIGLLGTLPTLQSQATWSPEGGTSSCSRFHVCSMTNGFHCRAINSSQRMVG